MNIEVENRYGFNLIITADNVKIEEDIEERIYHIKDDGKTDFSKAPERDIKTDSIQMIVRVLDDMVDYRKKELDTSQLIKNLFDKLPQSVANKLSKELYKNFNEEEQD